MMMLSTPLGNGWDGTKGMSRNAVDCERAGMPRIKQVARELGVSVAWLHGQGVRGIHHHIGYKNGRMQTAEYVDRDACYMAIYNNLAGWGANSKGLAATLRVMDFLAECI